ncbi:DEAD/DEAH box helicase [Flavobacterium tructae]|uniref:DEAD/DEAH box helicase n=1 Tax=Flavobacterium tructae TaxID=1114873 RepID=UPI0025520BC7|nr:DEAD/DEAH box helicase [Flavobacterium tructae]MDL2143851.1 DEAD/DEAH box helicase [Flavobacterium tructae]
MIAQKIFNLESFKTQYRAVLALSVCSTIKNLKWEEDIKVINQRINWNNLLGIASVLSYSNLSDHLEAALRIAQTCLNNESNENQKTASVVILENLTNIPALKLAVERNLIKNDYEDDLPLPFKLQTNKIKIENSILLDENVISLNRFQKKVFDSSKTNNSISISAPTSSGKSFILYQLLLEELKKKGVNIVYIVPTRALISQVEDDLRILLKENNIDGVNLTTVPLQSAENGETNLYVFTQERLHWYLLQSENSKVDFLLVDEAHKIDNSNRGILLQRKIEEVIDLNPEIRLFFSSPFTSNPEILLENIGTDKSKDTINTEFVAVNQNLLYVNQVKGKPKEWEIELILKDDKIKIGIIELEDRPTNEAKKIALITAAISNGNSGNLIYSNGAAESEKFAKILTALLEKDSSCTEIKELIKLVKTTIHREYILSKVLEYKIAFHYGNMPLLVRQEIEKLFKENKIKYLVCTSTLLEGVNLPATAVFIRKPTRGKGKPLNENDFWNLAGRAGRWGKEFSGNIICIEPSEWGIKPSPDKKKQKIEKALESLEQNNSSELLKYIKDGSPRNEAENNQEFEFAFSYYYSKYLQGKLIADTPFHSELIMQFDSIKKSIEIPNQIIFRNPGISPIAQQELLNYFSSKINELEDLIPVYPEDVNSYEEYIKLIGRIGKTLAEFPPVLNASRAILLINWMSGKPLSYLIRGSYNSYKKKQPNISIDKVCRDTMDEVENFARFRFAKESSCYIDILKYFLKSINRTDLIERIPDLNLWLEFGVSQTTQLSLLSLGLSRNTVISLTEFITNTTLNKSESLEWLKNADLNKLDLSPIMIQEIEKILSK